MGQGSTPPRSFNTVVNSNREQRARRQQKGRITLLSICTVIILILLTLIIFLIASIADVLGSNPGEPYDTTDQENNGSNSSVVYVPLAWESSKVTSGVLLVVNDEHEFDPDSVVGDLIDVYDNRTKINGSNPYQINTVTAALMHKEAFPHMEAMMQEHYRLTEGDGSILIKYAYRTYEDQENLGSVVKAGFSDHHTGCCIALHQGSASNPPAIDTDHWIYDNCHKYGFVPRYPVGKESETGVRDYEHCYRYVGLPHAAYMTENNLCLEEYVELLQTRYANGEHLSITDAAGAKYEVYYVPASNTELTTIQVPANYAYTVSGDNIGGFIITVDLSAPNA
ncbi:MAG: D-alanyl-D-alanine carboxypeptidase family protein [Clostridia bacterium]|nr:D-alanyl-D-alanine carboxypeptidase family protein [Clostridia bacterium]